MNRALLTKELREIWWIGLLAAIIVMLPVLGGMGFDYDERTLRIERTRIGGALVVPPPFTQSELLEVTYYTAAGLGLIVGLWQTLSESVQGTWQFLLHRPICRQTVIRSKLIAGLLVVLGSIGLPLLIYLLWALAPGTHPQPFALWMTQEVLVGWLSASLFYLAGFLCGIRPVRWWGSRLFPLAFVGVFALLAWGAMPTLTGLWLGIIVLTVAMYVAAVLFAARHRDYA